MSDHERGAYTPPTDSPLSFDARQPVRGSQPIPFTLIISILVLAALAAAIFVFYRSGVRQAGQPPHTVGEPVGDIKAPPPIEAQPQDPAAGLQIYKEDQPAAGQPQFTPPPELPQPRTAPPVQVVQPPVGAPTVPVNSGRRCVPRSRRRPAGGEPQSRCGCACPRAEPAAPRSTLVAKANAAPPPKPRPRRSPRRPLPPKPAASSGGRGADRRVSSTALADKAWNDAVAARPVSAGKGKSVRRSIRTAHALPDRGHRFRQPRRASAFCGKLKPLERAASSVERRGRHPGMLGPEADPRRRPSSGPRSPGASSSSRRNRNPDQVRAGARLRDAVGRADAPV